MNPYKVLQLEPGADKQTVKKAYFKLIRQFTPDKAPEKFKEIREAYEYLQKDDNLTDLQKAVSIPEEFVKPYYQVLEWMEKEEYDKAIALCENVLRIVKLPEFHVQLGRAYLMNGNSGKAVKIWEDICSKQKDNPEYLELLGDAYRDRGWYNKAVAAYDKLYRMNREELAFYCKFMELLSDQDRNEYARKIGSRALACYNRLEKHSREAVQSMSEIFEVMAELMEDADSPWVIGKAEEMLQVISKNPIEFELYLEALLHIYAKLIDKMKDDCEVEPAVNKYRDFIELKKESFTGESRHKYQLVQCYMEEAVLMKDIRLHSIIRETAGFWYGILIDDTVSKAFEEKPGNRLLSQMVDDRYDENRIYDTLLYMVNQLKELQESLLLIKQEYPYIARALGEYLDEMLTCSSQEYLFRKYEKRYRKLMGYPSQGRLVFTGGEDMEEEGYASEENGTYRREGAKIGRNDPCPCGSGKKYKQCCGR